MMSMCQCNVNIDVDDCSTCTIMLNSPLAELLLPHIYIYKQRDQSVRCVTLLSGLHIPLSRSLCNVNNSLSIT